MMFVEIPEIYRIMVENCYITQENLDEFLSLYKRLPCSTHNGYKPLNRHEMGRFAELQREMLEARVEAGDPKAPKDLQYFKQKLQRMIHEQNISHIGFI